MLESPWQPDPFFNVKLYQLKFFQLQVAENLNAKDLSDFLSGRHRPRVCARWPTGLQWKKNENFLKVRHQNWTISNIRIAPDVILSSCHIVGVKSPIGFSVWRRRQNSKLGVSWTGAIHLCLASEFVSGTIWVFLDGENNEIIFLFICYWNIIYKTEIYPRLVLYFIELLELIEATEYNILCLCLLLTIMLWKFMHDDVNWYILDFLAANLFSKIFVWCYTLTSVLQEFRLLYILATFDALKLFHFSHCSEMIFH